MRSLTFIFGCILTAAIPLTARGEDPRSFGLVERLSGEDASCDVVNRAYQKMANHGRFSVDAYEWAPGELGSPWVEYRYVQRSIFEQRLNKRLWEAWPRPIRETMENGKPVFTNCEPVAGETQPGQEPSEYSARWSRNGIGAYAKIRISNGEAVRIERHFDPGQGPYPFNDAVEFYHDAPQPSAPVDEKPAPVDPTCTEVVAAYDRTINTPRYSYWISQVKPNGRRIRALDARVIDRATFTRPHCGQWRRAPLSIDHITTDPEPLFQSCIQISSAAKEAHFAAKWHRGIRTIPIEIWLSPQTGRFLRTIRDYGQEPQEFHFPIALQIFDYDAAKATVPPLK
jgi:hypothetical protein